MANQYAERDIMALDKAGGHYCRHLSAMTGEALHDKSDIAAELAYRDSRIAELEEREAALAAHVEAAQKLADVDRIICYSMSPYPEGKPEGEKKGWTTKMGRDLHAALKGADTSCLAKRELIKRVEIDAHPNCELECGAYGTYCKCNDEGGA